MGSSLKPPYVSKIEDRDKFQVWIVDGSYVRGHIDEEFTNFGQHYHNSYITLDELWLDQEAEHNERQFFIAHLLVEYRLMAKGVPYGDAMFKADAEERKQYRRAGDLGRVTDNGNKLPEAKSVHERLWKKLENGISVWVVNGRLVRSVYDINFTEGGHDHVYEFVPENEAGIDDAIEETERGYVLIHELHERSLMAHGMTYHKAHAESSRLEYNCRQHPDELHDALTDKGWG